MATSPSVRLANCSSENPQTSKCKVGFICRPKGACLLGLRLIAHLTNGPGSYFARSCMYLSSSLRAGPIRSKISRAFKGGRPYLATNSARS